jgi:hypothetical protein
LCSTTKYSLFQIIFDQHDFEKPVWPRAIFTKTLGKQYVVYGKQEAIARFKQSNLLDCRINAYPDYTEFKGINE